MLKLRPGSTLALSIKQDEKGYILTPMLYVGNTSTPKGKARRCPTEEALWVEIETFAQAQLAQLGLEKIKP